MQINIPFAYNEDCYIIVNPDSIVVTPKVRKAIVRKIICAIEPAKINPKTNCEMRRTFTCMYKDDRGSEHITVVKDLCIFRTCREAVDKAKKIVTERFEKTIKQLEEVPCHSK